MKKSNKKTGPNVISLIQNINNEIYNGEQKIRISPLEMNKIAKHIARKLWSPVEVAKVIIDARKKDVLVYKNVEGDPTIYELEHIDLDALLDFTFPEKSKLVSYSRKHNDWTLYAEIEDQDGYFEDDCDC